MRKEPFFLKKKNPPSSVVIDRVLPDIDKGRFAVKRYWDEEVRICAHLLVHGHDKPKGRLWYRHENDKEFISVPLVSKFNDEWEAAFKPTQLGRYICRVEAALDSFTTWTLDLKKRLDAGQDVRVDLQIGAGLIKHTQRKLKNPSQKEILNGVLISVRELLKKADPLSTPQVLEVFHSPLLHAVMYDCFENAVWYETDVQIQIEPVRARFSNWYEFFPRSVVGPEVHHGTFKEAEKRLAYIKDMGFHIVYLPPIHPIGEKFRKGKNNRPQAEAGEPGSPWAIGGPAGGHKEIHPELGRLEDFQHFVQKARSLNLEIAMDIAFQCSPDHPYVTSHPEWFMHRPDGSIQYAENPPKKYQDIYPFYFEGPAWKDLWQELLSVVEFWVDKGVRVFRVDNPHTKSFHFWEWLIREVRTTRPDVIFLAEAFTRPKIMAYLAKAGFSQSYTYFTWRNVKWELTQYMNELTQTELKDYFGAHFWPNTPDILHETLQEENATVYKQRLVLAATLMSSYGIYGPAFELMEHRPRENGSEEYLDSEKYQLRAWNLEDPRSLAPFIKKINQIREQHPSLQQNRTFRFLPVDNEFLIAYAKTSESEKIVVVVNLDAHKTQAGRVELPLTEWKLRDDENFEMQDLLTDITYTWRDWRNFVELRPDQPAHIFKLKRIKESP